MHRLSYLLACATLMSSAGCRNQDTATAAVSDRPAHVDSIVPRAEALRRFQAGARPVDGLAGGAGSRDSLVADFVRALETRDTAGLRRLLLDRNEFAFLYYPTARQGLPPYDLAPELFWFMLQSGSDKGLPRALGRRGGRPLELQGYRCDSLPTREGRNVVWGPCLLRHGEGGRLIEERLFGLIVERDGRFKFVDYGNRL